MSLLVRFLAAGLCLFTLLYVSGTFAYAGVYFLGRQYNSIFLTVVLILIFLLVPASKRGRRSLPWYDILLILASVAGNLYIFANALELAKFGKMAATPLEIVLGAVTVVALMEAARRTMGWAMVIVGLIFLLYAKFGYLVSGSMHLYQYGWSSLAADFYLSPIGIYGSLLEVASTVIIAFITFGVFFTKAGAGKLFMNLALALAGRFKGGPAKAAVLASGLFGTISGSPIANVAVVGTITIPLMVKSGYKPHFAAAVEATASTGGTIMPPVMGGVAFVMANMLGISYATVCIMAIIPAILYYAGLFMQIHFRAAKDDLRGLSDAQIPSVKKTLKESWELIIPFLVLVLLLFVLKYTAERSAVYTIVSVIIVSLFRKENRMTWKRIVESLEGGAKGSMEVVAILALAGIILGVLVGTGLGPKLSSGLVAIFGGSMLYLVIASAVTVYILGMGVSLIASYILISALVAPALEKFGVPLNVAHFFIMYMVISTFITPPYCTAAMVAGAIARANPFRVGFQAMQLGIVCFLVPFIIIYNPALVMIGTPGEIIQRTLFAFVGIFALSIGIEGYLFTKTNWIQRILFMASGLLMFVPGLTTDLVGIGLLIPLFLWQRLSQQRAKAAIGVSRGADSSLLTK